MGGVDKTDMQLSLTECTHKTRKWYIKLFFHLVDMSLYNAYVLYKLNTSWKLQFIELRKLSRYLRNTLGKLTGQDPAVLWIILLVLLVRVHTKILIGWHFPSPVPETPGKEKKTRNVCATTIQPGELGNKIYVYTLILWSIIRYIHIINTCVCVICMDVCVRITHYALHGNRVSFRN